MDDAGLLAKYGVKSVDEVETGHKILARYGSDAASIGSEQFKAIHVLETRQAGTIEKLASSSKLSTSGDLVKVAELETRYSGIGQKIGELSDIDGIGSTVNRLHTSKTDNFIKGHRFEIEGAYQRKMSGETLVSMEETFQTESGLLRADLISRDSSNLRVATEFKNWNKLKLTVDTRTQLDKLKELIDAGTDIDKARVIAKGGNAAENYLEYAGKLKIQVFDENMNLLNAAYLVL